MTATTSPVDDGKRGAVWLLNFDQLTAGNLKASAATREFGAENVAQAMREVLDYHVATLWGNGFTDYSQATPEHLRILTRDHMGSDLVQEIEDNAKIVRTLGKNGFTDRVEKANHYLLSFSGYAQANTPREWADKWGEIVGTYRPDANGRMINRYEWEPIQAAVLTDKNGTKRLALAFTVHLTELATLYDGNQGNLAPGQVDVPVELDVTQHFTAILQPNPAGKPATKDTWRIMALENLGADWGPIKVSTATFPAEAE